MIEASKLFLPEGWKVCCGLLSVSKFWQLVTRAQRDAHSPVLSWMNIKSTVSLDAAGLVALADLTTIGIRMALTGTSALLDVFVLCPGIHRQQAAPELHGGEYPACGAMTTGYVFRVENPATVLYLQRKHALPK